ncbi:MAG: C39 family peptidase [Streptosporangiaceae bacterium]
MSIVKGAAGRGHGVDDHSLDPHELGAEIEVLIQPDELPDGEPSLMLGNAAAYAALNHRQGDNPEHFQLDCGLTSVQDVLRQFGADVTEGDIVEHAVQRGECSVDPAAPGQSGGTTPSQDARVLTEYGVPSSAESGLTIAELAALVEHGRGVIIGVNCGVLWQVPEDVGNGGVNHAVTVTGVALDPRSRCIQGFYINDSGNGKSAEFVRTVLIRVAWQDTGGWTIATNDAAVPRS